MPFVDRSAAIGARGGVADALAHDVSTRLAKLRSLDVIAQGTMFALHERRIGSDEAGRIDYVVSEFVRRDGKRLTVMVEVTDTRTARTVLAEIFNHKSGDTFIILDEMVNRIVASIANEIETMARLIGLVGWTVFAAAPHR
jgi:TolB-like protein